MSKGWVAITSIAPGPSTAELVRGLAGQRVLALTTTTKRDLLARVCSKSGVRIPRIATVPSFERGEASAAAMIAALRPFQLDTWINGNDQISGPYLKAIDGLGLSFPFLAPYRACRLKPIARSLARNAGVSKIAPLVASIDDPFSRIEGYLPRIAKPIAGAGSRHVKTIRSNRDWIDYCENFRADYKHRVRLGPVKELGGRDLVVGSDVLLEPVLQGVEVEIDGFVYESKVTVCAIGYKLHQETSIGFRELGCILRKPQRSDVDETIVCWATRLLAALSFTCGTFHIEAMLSRHGELELIEVNPRPGGGTVTQMVELVSGVRLGTLAPQLWLGLEPTQAPSDQSVSSVLCLIRYAWHDSIVRRIAKDDVGVLQWNGKQYTTRWYRQVKRGRTVRTNQGEVYLGEMHVLGFEPGPRFEKLTSLPEMVRDLRSWFEKQPLVTLDRI